MKKLIILGLVLSMIGCKTQRIPQERVVYKFVKDTTVIERSVSVVLPVKNVTILESPCKNDSLIIPTQIIKNERSRIKISSKKGKLVVETNIDSLVSTNVDKFRSVKDVEVREIEVFVDKPVRDRWYWGFLIYSLLASVWILKKPIIGILRRFILPI